MNIRYRRKLERILDLLIKAVMAHSSTDKAGYILKAEAKLKKLKKLKND